MAATEFDADRFREALLYVAWRTRGDEQFGRTKLAKTLFYADFSHYAESGQPLTGARYEHWPRGPFPPVLYDVQEEVVSEGLATVKEAAFQGDEVKLLPTKAPETTHLEPWELVLLDVHAKELSEQPTWKVSDVSHEHPGWELTRHKEEIPYEAGLVPTRPSDKAMEIGRQRFADEESPF